MNGWRCVRVLLTVLLVLVPAVAGVLAGSSAESEAAGLPGPQAAHGSDFTLLIQPDGSLWSWGADSAGRRGDGTTHTITASRGEGGGILPSGDVAVIDGERQDFAITPDAGYHVADVLVDGSSAGTETTYTFTNVISDHTITANFAIDTFTLTYAAGANGTISGSSPQTVNYNGSGSPVTAKPNTGYSFVNWSDGKTANPRTDTGVTANVSVTANFAIDTFTLTYAAGANGTISGTTTQTVDYGASGTAVTAVPNTGYHFVSWSDGVLAASRTDTNVTGTISVTASFAIDTFTLTYAAGANGTISGTTPQTVAYGASGTAVTAVPNTGYHFVSWSDGVTTAARTDANVKADHSVTASFAIDTFTITPTAGLHGAISPASPQTVAYGADQACTIAPATGYHVADVLVDAVSVGPVTSYTFSNVTANHTISASFAVNTYAITPSAGANGSISPKTPQTVAYGAEQAFTFAAATGYYIADVLVDGVSVGPVANYTFTAVAANHTISVSFAVGIQTRFSISVADTIVNYGSSTLLTGVLYDSADPLHEVGMGDRLVTVQSASSATGPWVDLETLTTSSGTGSVGMYTLTVTPPGPTYYRLRFVAGEGSGYGGSLSFVVRVGVRPVLGTPKVPASARAGRSFTVYGTLDPQLPAGDETVQINVYRYKNRHWVFARQVAATNADSGGSTRYGVKVKLTTKGKYRFRAFTAPTVTWAGDTTGLSTVLTVK